MANIFCPASSFPYTLVLTAFALAVPVVFALPPLTSEHNRRAPALAIMAAFSPLAITGFTLLAIVTSYSLLRLYRFLKPRLLSTATRTALPQPVSAGRTSSLSFYSPFSFIRTRQKSTSKPAPTWSRWSPLSSLFRRLTRPSSPLHLSGAELLPTTMPNSPSKTHSLIDLPVVSGSLPISISKNHGHKFKPTGRLSRSSSMDTLPSYRPLTPVPVSVPVPVHTISPPPSTPPPPSPTPLPGMTDSDIPLVPITPPKPKYTPAAMTSPSGLLTPPPTTTFPAISLSPFKPNNSTAISSNNVVGPRPNSPSPSLFLSSRTLSSLSLSPRSLYLQQHKRSKSLGGVAVKKISPPQFDLDAWEPEHTQDVVDSTAEADNKQTHTLIVPALEKGKAKEKAVGKSKSVSPATGTPKFLLNFSSSSSSTTSDSSLTTDLLSPSPLTSNPDSTPASAPLKTPRTTSCSSNSSDIAKTSEHDSLLPRPIPLVDIDMNVDADVMLGFGTTGKAGGWGFDAEEGVNVERMLMDFDVPVAAPFPASAEGAFKGLGVKAEQRVEQRLIEFEDADTEAGVEHVREEKWEWEHDPKDQNGWDLQAEAAADHDSGSEPAGAEVLPEDEDDVALPPAPSPKAVALDKEPNMDVEARPEMELEYPDPDLLPLPEAIDVPPSVLTKPADPPAISICTQDSVLRRDDSECDSDIVSASSIGRATPVSLGQTPTPPASPPREARAVPLPKVDKGSSESSPSESVGLTPVVECPVTIDVDTLKEEVPVVDGAEGDSPLSPREDMDVQVLVGLKQEDEEEGEGEEALGVPILDGPLVSSPASISIDLNESDREWTFNVEADDEEGDGDGDFTVEVEVVPASPCDRVIGWEYGSDDDEEPEIEAEVGPRPSNEVEEMECPSDDGAREDPERPDEEVQVVVKEVSESEERGVEEECSEVLTPEVECQPETLQEAPASPSAAAVTHELASVSTLTPVLQPSTSLPGTFPDAAPPRKPECEVQSLSPEPLPQPPLRRRVRSPLEEAIARTRSPLEAALAMQLRPGLGLGADPAWMVRFLMVMWGWMFGLVLVPSAEA